MHHLPPKISDARWPATLLLLLWLLPSIAPAQEFLDTAGRWKELNTKPLSGLANDWERPWSMFFSDSRTGYLSTLVNGYYGTPANTYKTTDRGVTWELLPTAIPVPFTSFPGNVAVSSDGQISRDGGTTWSKLYAPPSDSIRTALPTSATEIVGFYRRGTTTLRLAYTTDGGVTWHRADTLTSPGAFTLRGSTMFGQPAGLGPGPVYMAWNSLDYSSKPGEAILVATLTGDLIGDVSRMTYLVRIDLRNRTSVWTPLAPGIGRLRFISDKDVVAFAERFIVGRDSTPYQLFVRSSDGGVTWDSLSAANWIDPQYVRFLSPTHGVTANARTFDGGRTWERVENPFTDYYYLYDAIDSLHHVVVGYFSAVATSSDGGRTWRQNFSGAPAHTIAAHRSRVLIGRDHRSILLSRDSGESWRDLGAEGKLPPNLRTVWGLAFVDTLGAPSRVEGYGTFLGPNGPYTATLRSSDGGESWREGVRLPMLDSAVYAADTIKPGRFGAGLAMLGEEDEVYKALKGPAVMKFARHATGGSRGFIAAPFHFLVTNDNGDSWQDLCDSVHFSSLSMADADNGVATSLLTMARPGGLYATRDGGRTWKWTYTLPVPNFVPLALQAITKNDIRVIMPDQNREEHEWNLYVSSDGGFTWWVREEQSLLTDYRISYRYDGFWLDTTDLHVVGNGADIRHTTNGGTSFNLIHTRQSLWTSPTSDDWGIFGDMNLNIPNIGRDADYIYIYSPGNAIARWRISRRLRLLPASVAESGAGSDLALWPNPATEGRAWLRTTSDRSATVEVVDILGRVRITRSIDGREDSLLDVSALHPGRYIVRIHQGSTIRSLPMLIGNEN